MHIADEKKQLRREMLVLRSQLDKQKKEAYDAWVCEQLWKIITEQNYKTVHCYLPMSTEINILPLIQQMLEANITVVCPKTLAKRKLQNRVLTSLGALESGVYGTSHPSNPMEYMGTFDLILVPGLAFDSNNYRLGYGGGYYDNFLVADPTAFTQGIFYPFQKMERIPLEAHDMQLDDILIGKGLE